MKKRLNSDQATFAKLDSLWFHTNSNAHPFLSLSRSKTKKWVKISFLSVLLIWNETKEIWQRSHFTVGKKMRVLVYLYFIYSFVHLLINFHIHFNLLFLFISLSFIVCSSPKWLVTPLCQCLCPPPPKKRNKKKFMYQHDLSYACV